MRSRVTPPRRAALAAGALLAIAGIAAAQDQATPALPPQYEVEILVFGNRDFDPSEERFQQTLDGLESVPLETLREAPVFDDSTFDPRAQRGSPTPPTTPSPLDALPEVLRVRPLRPEELKLNNEYRKLRALSAYEPLIHAGWIQPGLPEADAQPFDLAVLGAVNPRGTVRVHLSRFLHITLDLTYQRPSAAADPASPALGDGLSEVAVAPRYRLTATRNARSGELHYFDHPAFGVLVRVTPVPAQSASPGRQPAA